MPRLFAFLIAFLASVISAHAASVNAYVRDVVATLYLPAERSRECGDLLKKSLGQSISSESLKRAQAAARSEGCLDAYSALGVRELRGEPSGEPLPPRALAVWINMKAPEPVVVIRIESFSEIYSDLTRLIRQLPQGWRQKATAVVIDLRGNPGGKMRDMRRVLAEHFAPEIGLQFAYATGTPNSGEGPGLTTRVGTFAGLPIRMIVNEETASAAEHFVGTIRHEWYPQNSAIVGRRTHGKGEIQCKRIVDGIVSYITCADMYVMRRDEHGILTPYFIKRERGFAPDQFLDNASCTRETSLVDRMLTQLRN